MSTVMNIVIAVVALAISGFLLPYLKLKLTDLQYDTTTKIINMLVEAAEQVYGAKDGSLKLESVKAWLKERGLTVSDESIEAAVLRLHADGLDWVSVHPGN